jgi:hypothetical protein
MELSSKIIINFKIKKMNRNKFQKMLTQHKNICNISKMFNRSNPKVAEILSHHQNFLRRSEFFEQSKVVDKKIYNK